MKKEDQAPPPEDPEDIFADLLQRLDAEEEADFEETVAAHPACAEELRRYHAEWNRWASVLEGAAPGPQSIEGVPAESTGDEAPRISSEILRQFAIGSDERHRYRFRSHLSSGGQGSILKVWDTELRRQLAMKLMLGEQATIEGETQAQYERKLGRFLDEAQITGQLDHPGVIPVHELGVSSSGRAFFTMRLVRGRHFGKVIDELHAVEEGQTLTRCVGVLQRICETMAFAHSRGIVHRDLKPENVMVGPFGEVYVMDWGLARVLGKEDQRDLRIVGGERDLGTIDTIRKDAKARDPESPLFTADGAAIGTPMYMSPEQARGELEVVGPRSDVYAVGAMIYHLLAGHAPYLAPGTNASAYAVWRWVMEGPPRAIAEIAPSAPEELVAICEKAMAREVEQRYESMKDLLEDLQAYAEGRVVQAHRTGALVELRKWVARNRSTAAAGAAAILLAIAAPVIVALVANAKNETITAQQEELQDQLASSHMQVAELASQRGDAPAILESLEMAREAGYHDSIEIAWKHADALIVSYRHEEAQAEFEALCERDDLGRHAGAVYLRLGHLLLHTWGDSKEGLIWIQKALDAGLEPGDLELAKAYTAGSFADARVHCLTAIEHDPYHYLANSHLLALLMLTGNRDGASHQAALVEKLFPADPTPVVYRIFRSALDGQLDATLLEDPVLITRIGEGNVAVLRSIVETLLVLVTAMRGDTIGTMNPILAGRTLMQTNDLVQGAAGDPHRRFAVVDTPAMPLLKNGYLPVFAALFHMACLSNESIEPALCGGLQIENGTFIEHVFGKEYDLESHAEWEASLRDAFEVNGDGIVWLTLANLIMLRPGEAGDPLQSATRLREAEAAFRGAFEVPSVLPSLRGIAGPMMVYSQSILGTAKEELADPEMLELAHRNLEELVYFEGLSDLHRGYLVKTADQLKRSDLKLLIWRQAVREKPESRSVRRELAGAALAAGHWAEARQVAEGLLAENPKDEKALKIRTTAIERGRQWLTAEASPPTPNTNEEER